MLSSQFTGFLSSLPDQLFRASSARGKYDNKNFCSDRPWPRREDVICIDVIDVICIDVICIDVICIDVICIDVICIERASFGNLWVN